MVTNQNRVSAYLGFLFYFLKLQSWHFANAYRILKYLKCKIQLLFKPHYV